MTVCNCSGNQRTMVLFAYPIVALGLQFIKSPFRSLNSLIALLLPLPTAHRLRYAYLRSKSIAFHSFYTSRQPTIHTRISRDSMMHNTNSTPLINHLIFKLIQIHPR